MEGEKQQIQQKKRMDNREEKEERECGDLKSSCIKREINKYMTIAFVSFSFNFSIKQKYGYFGPSEKVLDAKIVLHKNEWVYCSKPQENILNK